MAFYFLYNKKSGGGGPGLVQLPRDVTWSSLAAREAVMVSCEFASWAYGVDVGQWGN